MARAGLDSEAITTAAAALADAEGLGAVTLTRVASDLGVRAPSLYAHVGGLQDLRARVGARGAGELADVLQTAAAGRARVDALRSIGHAYRDYAKAHQGMYAALQRASDDDDDPAVDRLVAVVLAVLRGYGLRGDDALHAARSVRAALHGFVTLETADGFGLPLALDESFERLLTMLDRGLEPG